MKYIKKFESKREPLYSVGDWVEIYSGEIVVITDVDDTDNDSEIIEYEGVYVENPYQYINILEEYINKLLTDEEIETYKTAKKYNL